MDLVAKLRVQLKLKRQFQLIAERGGGGRGRLFAAVVVAVTAAARKSEKEGT